MRGVATGGSRGPKGADGAGVPVGGTTGQVLAKNSNADLDTGWVDPGARSVSMGAHEDLNITVGGANGAFTSLVSGSITDAPAGKYILQAQCFVSSPNSGAIYLQYSLNGSTWVDVPNYCPAGTHNVSGGYKIFFGYYDHAAAGTVYFRMVFMSEGYNVTIGYANDRRWGRYLLVYRVGGL